MPPLLRPSPTPSKEPPDKPNTYLLLSAPRPTIDTSLAMPPDQLQPQPLASPTIRPPFNPFFTLIHDTATATTHHPRNVHYIFSDDDPSLLTTACLSVLSPSPPGGTSPTSSYPTPSNPRRPAPHPSTSSSSTASKSPSSSTAAPHGKGNKSENRILVLDLDDSGTAVTKAHSLSSSWQIINTSLTPAPTWDESPSEPHPSSNGAGPGFMLKISGTDGRQVDGTGVMGLGLGGAGAHGRGESKGGAGMTEAEFQALMLEFDSRMKVLRTVVEAGGEVVKREGEGKGEGDGTAERGEEDTGAKGEI